MSSGGDTTTADKASAAQAGKRPKTLGLGFDKGASEAQLNTLSNLKDMKDKYKGQQGEKKDNKSA